MRAGISAGCRLHSMPKNRTCLITLVLLIPSLAQATYCPPQGKPGAWSKQATYLCSRAVKQGFARDIRVYSPDRSKAVHVVNGHWFVEVGKTTLRLSSEESYVSDYPAELSWSPDSSAFYITQSDATSEINGFHTELYRVNEQTVRRMQDIWSMVNDRFGKRHECVNEDPNVAGLEWVGGSSQIVVIAEIPPDSVCAPREYFAGYLISIADSQVMHEYGPPELFRRLGGVFGVRLRGDYHGLHLAEREEKP